MTPKTNTVVGYNSLTITRNGKYLMCIDERRFDVFAEIFTESAEVNIPSMLTPERECHWLKEIRDIHTSLFRLIRSSHHMSGDYIFEALTDNAAEVRCNVSGCYNSFGPDGGSYATGTAKFSATMTDNGWRIQRMRRRTKCSYSFSKDTKIQE